MLDEFLMLDGKRGGEVAVDVEFADDLAVSKDWHHDFGLGLERTGEISRIFADVVDDDRLARWRQPRRRCPD